MSTTPSHQETEVKIPLASREAGRQLLERHGFVVSRAEVFEVNLILDSPDHVLRQRGEILRLRQAGSRFVLTYKGPAVAGRHKSREELEVGVSDLAMAQAILERLGYVARFRYEKYRTEYQRPGEPGLVTLDHTPIGAFLELEGPAEWIDGTAQRLGFSMDQYITDSYGRLYLLYCERQGVPADHMVFSPRH